MLGHLQTLDTTRFHVLQATEWHIFLTTHVQAAVVLGRETPTLGGPLASKHEIRSTPDQRLPESDPFAGHPEATLSNVKSVGF